jgi:hypothetical protein
VRKPILSILEKPNFQRGKGGSPVFKGSRNEIMAKSSSSSSEESGKSFHLIKMFFRFIRRDSDSDSD